MWWVSRVPSKSNIADLPSRQEPQKAADMIGGQVVPPIACGTQLVDACLSVASFVDYMQLIATTHQQQASDHI